MGKNILTMERMISNPEGFVPSNRSTSNLALQLRYAAERGRVHDVKRLLEAGAGIHKDSVRNLLHYLIVCVMHKIFKFRDFYK